MKEQNYFKLIFATAILLLLCTIASFVLLVVYFSKGLETPGNNVFELMYMSFHFLVVALIAVFSLRAIKSGESLILTTLMYDQHHQRSKPARIIALVFAGLGFAFFTYELIVTVGVNAPHFTFPLGLRLDILNTTLTLFLMGLVFFFYQLIKGKTNK